MDIKGISPCMVDIINGSSVSMVCSGEPSIEDAKLLIYQHVYLSKDMSRIRIACYHVPTLKEYMIAKYKEIVFRLPSREQSHFWCGEIHFERLHGWNHLHNIKIISNHQCDSVHLNLKLSNHCHLNYMDCQFLGRLKKV